MPKSEYGLVLVMRTGYGIFSILKRRIITDR